MIKENFEIILKHLNEEKIVAQNEHDKYLTHLNEMIKLTESILDQQGESQSARSQKTISKSTRVQKTIMQEVLDILERSGKELHLSEIKKIVNKTRGKPIMRNTLDGSIHLYMKKYKKKSQINRLGNGIYSFKN